jgi:hypothetical protein
MNQLNAFLALETIHDNIERAERERRAREAREPTPATGCDAVTIQRPRLVTRRLRRAFAVLRH